MERPKTGEDEDDLLKFQQEFLASQTTSSASIVKKGDYKRKSGEIPRDVIHLDTLPPSAPSLQPQPPKKSRFKMGRDKTAEHSKRTDSSVHVNAGLLDMDPEELLDAQDCGLAAVLTSIIERDTRHSTFTEPLHSKQPFPLVVKNSSLTKDAGHTKSLFAQQIARQGVQDFGLMVQEETSKMDISDSSDFTAETAAGAVPGTFKAESRSHIVDGRGLSASQAEEEARSIHQENLTKLSQMSQEEIFAEQQQLLQILDPSIVAFLKSKSRPLKSASDEPKAKPSQKRPQKEVHKKEDQINALPEDVPLEEQGKWVHMDKIEYDKLQWMKDLPPPSADTKMGQQARFDFHGNIVPADADVPVHQGLHHHGDEPERAGYSIGELFQLARSSNVQQRVMALTTLGHVFQKAKEGSIDSFIQTPILPSCVDGGIIFLLRWACDDSVESVQAAAVFALCALLCNPADEAAMDIVTSWYQGSMASALVPSATVELMERSKAEEDEENNAQETDADAVKRDLIQGLVSRMVLLERLFYILDTKRPQAPTVISILNILTRVAHHSTQMAYEITRNTKLMSLIFCQFLPTTWKFEADQVAVSSAYGRPLAAAMRLIGSLCQTGRHIVSTLLSTYSLHRVLLRYLAVKTVDLQLSPQESENLQRESYRTWKILLSYGLAGDNYMEMYEFIVSQLQDLVSHLSDLTVQQPATDDVLFMSVLEAVLPVAAIPLSRPGFNQSESEVIQAVLTPGTTRWNCVEGLLSLVRLCASRCLTHLSKNYTQQKTNLQFPAACLNFLATYHSKWQGQSAPSTVEFLQQVEQFSSGSLQPFLQSWGFRSILANLSTSSNMLSSPDDKRRETVRSLPELGCDSCPSRVPVVSYHSPVGFLLALFRLVFTLCKVHKGIIEQTTRLIVSHEDILSYVRKVTSCPNNHLHANHFTWFENLLQYFFIKLCSLAPPSEHLSMIHQLALDLTARLQDGDEYLAHDLMTSVLFNADFLPEGREEELASASMAEMKLSETHFLKSATQEEVDTSNCQLLREAFKSLATVRGHYFKAFAHTEGKLAQSRFCYHQVPQDISSMQSRRVESYLMPQDWVFLPLVELYNLSSSGGSRTQAGLGPSSVSMVTSTLQWIFLLEMWRSRSLAGVSVTLKISRIMCTFLAGNDLFLERSVYPYLASLFRCYTTPRLLSRMDFDEEVPGISSFYDLYMLFLDQYEAVSFGDQLFGAFVLLPMQQSQNCMLRRAVWQERPHLLRTLSIPVREMLIDIDRFLNPDETDIQLLQLYASSLLSGTVRQRWSPVLFLLAVHHLNHFLFYTADEVNCDVRQKLWDSILHCQDEDLKEIIILFKQAEPQAQNGMQLYPQLPPNRQAVCNKHKYRLGLLG